MNKTSTKEILEQFKNTKSIEDIYIPKGLRKEHYLEIENGTPVLKKKHSKILTAQEVLDSNLGFDEFDQPIWTNKSVKRAMIEFAKQHVEAALKEASEKVKRYDEYLGSEEWERGIDKESILNAYPKENIR